MAIIISANDTVIVVGQQPGDDYTTMSAALASVPADLTLTAGRYIIQVRNDNTYTACRTPVIIDDETHYIIVMAFPGDEVNGLGIGANVLSSNKYIQPIVIRNGYDRISGIKASQTGVGAAIYSTSPSGGYAEISDCYAVSEAITFQLSNGYSGTIHLENNIFLPTSYGVSIGNHHGRVTVNKLTVVGGPINIGGSGTGSANIKNTAVFDSSAVNYKYSAQTKFLWSYIASSDTSASSQKNVISPFDNRVITDDLIDPTGETPNYNISPASTLKGAGLDGSDIGAYLGAIASIPNIELTSSVCQQKNQALKASLYQVHNLSISVARQINKALMLSLASTSVLDSLIITQANKSVAPSLIQSHIIDLAIGQQKNKTIESGLIQKHFVSVSLVKQLNKALKNDISQQHFLGLAIAQQINNALNVDLDQVHQLSSVFAEQKSQAKRLIIGKVHQLGVISSEQINKTLSLTIGQVHSLISLVAEQRNKSLLLDVVQGLKLELAVSQQLNQQLSNFIIQVHELEPSVCEQHNSAIPGYLVSSLIEDIDPQKSVLISITPEHLLTSTAPSTALH